MNLKQQLYQCNKCGAISSSPRLALCGEEQSKLCWDCDGVMTYITLNELLTVFYRELRAIMGENETYLASEASLSEDWNSEIDKKTWDKPLNPTDMSEAKIIITNINNIDWETRRIIDDRLVETRNYHPQQDRLVFENVNTNQRRTDTLMTVSLYYDLLIEGGEKYAIISMTIRPTANDQPE